MLIGHNPGLRDLASSLAARDEALREKFPTGALATLTFTCAWNRIGPGCAELSGFVRPRDLARSSR